MNETAPRRKNRRPASARPVLAGVALAVSLCWYVLTSFVLSMDDAANDDAKLALASRAFEERLALDQLRVRGECELLSQDPRFRAMLAREIDAASIDAFVRHIADHVVKRPLVAILTPRGRVLASSSGNLTGGELAKTSVVRRALDDPQAQVGTWRLDGSLVNVAVRAITLGDQILALLVVGATVDDELLRDVERVTGVGSAVAVGPTVVASSGSIEDFQPHLDLAKGEIAYDGGRIFRADSFPAPIVGVRTVWRGEASTRPRRTALLLVPVVAAFLLGVVHARGADREARAS